MEQDEVKEMSVPPRLIVTDGVFSMDGNVCPLPQIKELADRSVNWLLGC